MRHSSMLFVVIGLNGLAAGCAHQLEVRNLEDYKKSLTHGPRQNVAVLPFAGADENRPLFEHVTRALASHPSVKDLRTEWNWEETEPGFRPDLVVEVAPRCEYSGSPWNLAISFPGFLLFTHAWHGYVYRADVSTDYKVYDPGSRREIAASTLETPFSMRHCDFGRAFWASTGWYTPGYGASSLLSGFYMMTYDGDATAPFLEKIQAPYGEYVAENILGPVVELARREGGRREPATLLGAKPARQLGQSGIAVRDAAP